jgi:hypothetical protein
MEKLNIPNRIDELLYDWQRAEILKRIPQPITCLFSDDPDWASVDSLMVAENNVMHLSKSGDVEVTVHELLPGVYAVWIMDDYDYPEPTDPVDEAILINSMDLHIIREGGMEALLQYHLFKSF